MPLIKPKAIINYVTKKIKISKKLAEEIEYYCEWAEIQEVDHFFAEAAKEILKRDREYANKTKHTGA